MMHESLEVGLLLAGILVRQFMKVFFYFLNCFMRNFLKIAWNENKKFFESSMHIGESTLMAIDLSGNV